MAAGLAERGFAIPFLFTQLFGDGKVSDDPQPTKPTILINTYGTSAPDAAKFGVGTSTRHGAQEAQDARRNVRPGEYGKR
jgi:hypothetical protein